MREQIIEIIRNACALDETNLDLETKLQDISLDSLSYIEILVKVEQIYGIEFDDKELDIYNWEEVGDIVELIEKKLDCLK